MLFEKRKFERFDFTKELIISADHPDENKSIEFYARTLNISRGGMLIYTIAQFEEKTKCEVRFKNHAGVSMLAKGKILRIVNEGRPDFLKENESMYAFEFLKTFSEKEISDILEEKVKK